MMVMIVANVIIMTMMMIIADLADHDVALEVDGVRVGEPEHGVESRVGRALLPVQLELRYDVSLRAPADTNKVGKNNSCFYDKVN